MGNKIKTNMTQAEATDLKNFFHAEIKSVNMRLDKEVGDLKSDVAGLKSEVGDLKSDVAGLKSDVAGLKSDVAGLKREMGDLKSDVAGLKQYVEQVVDKAISSMVKWVIGIAMATLAIIVSSVGVYIQVVIAMQ